MKVFILFKYHNYGRIGERKEVMSVCTDMNLALRLSEQGKWAIEEIPVNRIRVSGGCMSADKWVEEKELVTLEQEQILRELNLWRGK